MLVWRPEIFIHECVSLCVPQEMRPFLSEEESFTGSDRNGCRGEHGRLNRQTLRLRSSRSALINDHLLIIRFVTEESMFSDHIYVHSECMSFFILFIA